MSLNIDLGSKTINRVKKIRGFEVRLDEETDKPRIAIISIIGFRDPDTNKWRQERIDERYLTVEQSQYILGLKSSDAGGADLTLGQMLLRVAIGIESGQIVLPEPIEPPV